MKNLVEDVWTHEDEIRLGGAPLYLRMTIVRLSNGKLWVHSPTPISDELVRETSELGDVAWIVGPNNAHNLFLRDWVSAFPEAELVVSNGIPKKLKLKDGFTLMGADFDNVWAQDLDRIFMPGVSFFDESVFLHRKSKSLILTDYIQNHEGGEKNFVQKFVLGPIGFKGICIAPPLKMGFMHKDKAGFRESIKRIKQWQFDRVVVAHGDIIEEDAMAIVDRVSERFM
ncbi:MAG: DUF4336 domain-containing protein [Pseudomonadales bacterium]